MTNKLAIIFGVLIVVLFLADHFFFDWNLPVTLGKKLAVLSNYIAFWR